MKDIDDDLTTLYEELCTTRKGVLSRKEEVKKEEGERVVTKTKSYETIQTKKLDAPHFSGQIRDYPF